jgi:regulator of replication initiation timing
MEKLSLGPKENPAPSGTPFELFFPPYSTHYVSSTCAIESSEDLLRPVEEESYHQRASSDSFLVEQLSWLDELLDEPDSPLYKGHRRSSSDSVAFLDTATKTFRKEETKLKTSATAGGSTWEFHSINYHENSLKTSFHPDSTPKKEKNKSRESPLISVIGSSSGVAPSTDSITLQVFAPQEPVGVGLRSKPIARQNQEDSEVSSNVNHSPCKSKTDSKRAKQQFAQRSRLKKLQYIAQLERSVKILETGGSQVSANLEYLYRQSLTLGMENQALRQRLVSLSQEQLAKYLEQDMLEKEIARLKFLYYQKQQQQQWPRQQKQKQNEQQKYSTHNISTSRGVESQKTNLYI